MDTDGCDQGCINTLGSFQCDCDVGYELNEDGFTCDGNFKCRAVRHNIIYYVHDIVLSIGNCYGIDIVIPLGGLITLHTWNKAIDFVCRRHKNRQILSLCTL